MGEFLKKYGFGRFLVSKGRLSKHFRNLNIALFSAAFLLILLTMLSVFNVIVRRVSGDFAERYALSAVNTFGARIDKELGLLGKAAGSLPVTAWMADEENAEKKAAAYEELTAIAREVYSANLYVGVEESLNEYVVDLHSASVSAVPVDRFDLDDPEDAWYFTCIGSDSDYMLEVNMDHLLERKRLWLDYKVMEDDAALGVVSTGLEFSHIVGELFAQSESFRMRGLILDDTGMVLMDSVQIEDETLLRGAPGSRVGYEFSDPRLLEAVDRYFGQTDGYFRGDSEPAVVEISAGGYSYATILPIYRSNWLAVILYDSSAFIELCEFLPAIVLTLICLIGFTLATNAISFRLFFMPLELLIQSLSKLKENPKAAIYGIGRQDEFGALSNTVIDLFTKANYDALTGIYNRRFMEFSLQQNMEFLSRSGGTLSVVMADVDYFKLYNDTYGHQQGDKCLKAVAGALSASVTRNIDYTVRYGGEEFVIVLPNTDEDGARLIADRVLENVRQLHMEHTKSAAAEYVTVSVGFTTGVVKYTHHWAEYVKTADDALYQSKQNGRNRATYIPFAEAEKPAV